MNWPLFLAEGTGVVILTVVLVKRGFFKQFKGGGGGGGTSGGGRKKTEERVVAIGKGQQISYLAGGKQGGSTVLLLHGFAADKEHWLDLFPHLEKEGYQY